MKVAFGTSDIAHGGVAQFLKEKGCEFPVASQSRSPPQIISTESLAPPSIYRAEAPAFLWLPQV